MDWLRNLIPPILASGLAWVLAVNKSAKDTDVKLAVHNEQIDSSRDALKEFEAYTEKRFDRFSQELKESKEMAAMELAQVASDVKEAVGALHMAASQIQALSQTQAVVNQMVSETLKGVVSKLDNVATNQAELKGHVAALKRGAGSRE